MNQEETGQSQNRKNLDQRSRNNWVSPSNPSRKNLSFINFLTHLHPRKIPGNALDITRTFGLGGMSLILILMLAFSGSAMLFFYRPLPEFAHNSISQFQDVYIFGSFIRSIHYFSANLLVIISSAHLFRVFFTQSFHGIRKFNWIIGLTILVFILLSCFTGYLLPWDQTAYWAITICLAMFEYLPVPMDTGITATTLQVFFTLHTTVIPICFLAFLPLHFWKIRKAKGIALPGRDKGVLAKTMPSLLLRELVAALSIIALVMMLSAIFKAPLGEMANPGLSPNPAKAPWYFLGFQELLLHFHPVVAAFLVPGILLVLAGFLPYKKYDSQVPAPWFSSKQGKKSGIISLVLGSLITLALILLDDFSQLTADITLAASLILVFILMGLTLVYYKVLKKKYRLSNNEGVQAIVILTISSYLTLTMICSWFRGEGMKLAGGIF